MGESITEATILKWLKKEGDVIELDEPVLEIATDKVDSEVPSPVAGVMGKLMFAEDDIVEVGKAIALIMTEGESASDVVAPAAASTPEVVPPTAPVSDGSVMIAQETVAAVAAPVNIEGGRFYSPLVLNVAKSEGISFDELETVAGTGKDGRVTKNDILSYVKIRANGSVTTAPVATPASASIAAPVVASTSSVAPATSISGEVEIIEMDRMRKMIAEHMVKSVATSPHVTSFVEVDVTNLVNWRNKNKNEFANKYGEKLTFTPLFIEACAKALNDYPMVNVSVDGTNIIRHKNFNIGMAAALPSGNLIVPVIKQCQTKNLLGIAKDVNELTKNARENKLKPEDTQGGTFTMTNVGTFGNLSGTPIINMPQAAILSTGSIIKKPAVVETPQGDFIAIRQLMFLSLSYDHRVVDGALGGSFLRRVGDYLEQFDINRTI